MGYRNSYDSWNYCSLFIYRAWVSSPQITPDRWMLIQASKKHTTSVLAGWLAGWLNQPARVGMVRELGLTARLRARSNRWGLPQDSRLCRPHGAPQPHTSKCLEPTVVIQYIGGQSLSFAFICHSQTFYTVHSLNKDHIIFCKNSTTFTLMT